MTRARGLALQAAWAEWIRPWFPRARSTPNGVGGTDVQNTPGIFWEVKTIRNTADKTTAGVGAGGRNRFNPRAWVASAAARADTGQLPIGVFFPEGIGEKRPELAIGLLRAPDLMKLLERAGYTEIPSPLVPDLAALDDDAGGKITPAVARMLEADRAEWAPNLDPPDNPKHPEGLPF